MLISISLFHQEEGSDGQACEIFPTAAATMRSLWLLPLVELGSNYQLLENTEHNDKYKVIDGITKGRK